MDKAEIIKALQGHSDTPELDAHFFWTDTQDDALLQHFIARRKAGEPVAKILGHKGFWSLELAVSGDTLDPRPDSETLIAAVLKHFPNKAAPLRILDVGTGSGCLLLALLSEYPNATGVGVDISHNALAIARKNGAKYAATFEWRDCTQPDWTKELGTFDVIISNPPYIPTKEIATLDKETLYDPQLALDGGEDGLTPYRILAPSLPTLRTKDGHIFLEIGQGQEKDVKAIMAPLPSIAEYRDLSGIVRCLVF